MAKITYKIKCKNFQDCGEIVERVYNVKTASCFNCKTERQNKKNKERYTKKTPKVKVERIYNRPFSVCVVCNK